MRIHIAALAGILLFSHAQAVDQLIKLPKPGELANAAKAGAAAAPAAPPAAPATPSAAASAPSNGAVAARDSATLKEKIAASDATAASAAKQAQRRRPATAHDEDEENIQLLAERISTRLAALRKEKEARPAVATKRTAVVKASHVAAHAQRRWSYEGEGGPGQWGKMNPAWTQCESGSRQSPIDIRDGIRVDLEPVGFDYHPTRFSVLDNGHTIEVSPGAGNAITVTGRKYELEQFHFHLPSEERINGKSFPMVLHLVHKDAGGKLAIVAVLAEEGTANNTVQQVWNNLPLEKNDPLFATSLLDLPRLLPERREYYTYMGSLTTPPCSEGVLWIVLKEPIQLSGQQIAIFSRLYPMNARPIQAQAGRLIKESN